MTILRLASPRPAPILVLVVTIALGACGSSDPTATPVPSRSAPSDAPSATPVPTAVPTPTAAPTPRFTNDPDPELAAIIPTEVNGIPVVVPPVEEFALTPGDIGLAYGEIGARFSSLAIGYVGQPRTTLYAMRVDGEAVATEDLEPHLATAGRYVGIAGLDPEPWERSSAGGHDVWVRPEDNATALGTMIYTWSSGDIVFLLIGVDDGVNRALIEALPGEAAATPTPVPSASPSEVPASGSPQPGSSDGG